MAKRTDNNQKAIMAALRKIGCSVFDTHTLGKGFPDLAVGWVDKQGRRRTVLMEIKDGDQPPSRNKLTTDEKLFHFGYRGEATIVYSVEDAIHYVTKS